MNDTMQLYRLISAALLPVLFKLDHGNIILFFITINNQILNTNTITHINTIANTTQRVRFTDLCVHIFPVWRAFAFWTKHNILLVYKVSPS